MAGVDEEASLLEDYNIPVTESVRGRKRTRDNAVRKKSKRYKADDKRPQVICTHRIGQHGKKCQASRLSDHDIQGFFNRLYECKDKVAQDSFILKHIHVSTPKRFRRRNERSKRAYRLETMYKIRKVNKQFVLVCQKTFMSVLGISRFRVNRLARYYMTTGRQQLEKRGGSRKSARDIEVDNSIIEWIKRYKCRESHYGRSKSIRNYLPPTLTIKKMWKEWKRDRQANDLTPASLSKFRKIFCTKFNLGFGNPRQDVCSFCEEMRMKIKAEDIPHKKQELITQFKLHKTRAKKFFTLMNEKKKDTLNICFDMQQNQPLPKLSIGEVFYSRQVWLYNLTIMKHDDIQKKEDIHLYTWLETEAGRGANQVSSALLDYLTRLDDELQQTEDPPTKLNLFSDACASQNKNTIVLNCIRYFLKTSKVVQSVAHYFPVRGHSYMAPDRVFGRIEKDLRRFENIVSPQAYYEIYKEHGQVHELFKDWSVFNHKEMSKVITKTKLPFKMQVNHVFTYTKNTFAVQEQYEASPNEVIINRQGKSVMEMSKAQKIQKLNHVKAAKKADMIKLMKFFSIPEDAKPFYDSVAGATLAGDGEVIDEYYPDEPFV